MERDLSAQLSIALEKSVDVGKYPKSAIDVFVSVLDCEGGLGDASDGKDGGVEVGLMGVVAGAISCASAAIADAGIECFDLVAGGVAGLIRERGGVVKEDYAGEGMEVGEDIGDARHGEKKNRGIALVLDPSPTDGYIILAAAAVGYMAARDELTLVWTKGSMGREGDGTDEVERLVDGAITAATSVRLVINEAVKERLLLGLKEIGLIKGKAGGNDGDTIMG